MGSQQKLVDVMEKMVGEVGGDYKKIVPIHEEKLKDVFPSRLNRHGPANQRDMPG